MADASTKLAQSAFYSANGPRLASSLSGRSTQLRRRGIRRHRTGTSRAHVVCRCQPPIYIQRAAGSATRADPRRRSTSWYASRKRVVKRNLNTLSRDHRYNEGDSLRPRLFQAFSASDFLRRGFDCGEGPQKRGSVSVMRVPLLSQVAPAIPGFRLRGRLGGRARALWRLRSQPP